MNKTYSHRCGTCYKTYFAYDPDRVFCSSACEAFYKVHGRGYNYSGGPGRPKQEKKPIEIKEEKPKEPKRKIDLKNIMYRDTFKQYIPRSLRVMRG